MKINEIAEKLSGNILCGGSDNSDITEVYAGDFLSRVMGNAPAESCWLTVMSNVNVAGVATLADIKCIVLCESVKADPALIEKCNSENIALIETALPVYKACKIL